ncbi:GNAT family N-acetyltransferase [Aquabacter sp. P-9]|uniref:GNAT family N-acetyltransferase n=1 Tax=Aquabacter sediminis TaxID=3029197 RepID=UPI00237D537B|nr:GNAT family N-acetyltransferase [Aquabacter sp. P-9]MDE1568106.1 GNAT family N-acetyltransferase [Aquabacter sp. P-9]
MKIRPALPDHVAGIAAIYDDAVRHGTASFELEPPDLAEMMRRYQALKDGGFPYFVAEDGEEVLGYAYAGAFRPRIAYRWTLENSVYVAPAAHKRGVGRALMEALLAECEALGFRQMVAVIGDSANAGSIALHRACGFRHIGVLPATGFKFGRWIDTVLMQRELGAGDATLPGG